MPDDKLKMHRPEREKMLRNPKICYIIKTNKFNAAKRIGKITFFCVMKKFLLIIYSYIL